MVSAGRESKFHEILKQLLQDHSATVTRKKLASTLKVSDATVSHYVNGRIKPSFDALLGIAGFFNVSLDYLVYGERPHETAVPESAAVRAEVKRALADANDYNGRQRDLIVRVSRRLHEQIEQVAADVISDPENLGPVGFVTDPETMALEGCARQTRIMIREMPADLTVNSRGGFEPGVYFGTLAANIRSGYRYQYLFYGKPPAYKPFVAAYRDLLAAHDVPLEMQYGYVDFKVIDSELSGSVVIHDLDIKKFQRREPILWERFRENGINGDTFAYMSMRYQTALGGVVLQDEYFDSALRMFDKDWRDATALTSASSDVVRPRRMSPALQAEVAPG